MCILDEYLYIYACVVMALKSKSAALVLGNLAFLSFKLSKNAELKMSLKHAIYKTHLNNVYIYLLTYFI